MMPVRKPGFTEGLDWLFQGDAHPKDVHSGRMTPLALCPPHWRHIDQVEKLIKAGGDNPYLAKRDKRSELWKT